MKGNIIKRISCIAFAAILMLSGIGIGSYALPDLSGSAVYAEALPAAALKITTGSTRSLMQGDTAEFSLSLKNQTKDPITYDSFKISFADESTLKAKVKPTGTVTLKENGEAEISFELTASRYFPVGTYQYSVTLLNEGKEVYNSRYFYFSVIAYSTTGGNTNPHFADGVEINAEISPEDGFYIGSNNYINVDVYNAGQNTVKNSSVTIKLPAGTGIANGSNTAVLGYIDSGKSKSTAFQIKVEDDTVSGNLEFTVEFNGTTKVRSDGGTLTEQNISSSRTYYYYVNAKEKDDEDAADAEANPRIMVKDYSCGGGSVAAGSTVNLNMNLVNTSKKNLYNVKVAVSGDGTFVPVGSSNSFYIEKIASKEVVNHVMTLKSDFEATPGAKGITVSMSYEDSKGTTYTSEDTISVKVTQPCKLVIGQLTPPMEAYVGQEAYIELSYYNMGKNTLSNLMVSIAGNFDQTQNNNDFVGNMTSGSDNDYSCYIVPREVGTVEGVITIQYDDTEGQTVIEEVPFSFEAMEWSEEDWGWEDPEPIPEGPSIPWKAIIILGAILLLVIGFLVFRKIRKNRLNKKLAIEDAAYELPEEKDAAEQAEVKDEK